MDSHTPKPEALLQAIGDFKTTIPIDPVPPSDDPHENELWIRRRAVLTHTFYQNYPNHDKALSCILEYWMLMGQQPHLFLGNYNLDYPRETHIDAQVRTI